MPKSKRVQFAFPRLSLILIVLLPILFSCQKEEIDQVSLTTTISGSQFHGSVNGIVRFSKYKAGFRVIDESKPLETYRYFCQSNMNKTEFTEVIELARNSKYHIAAEIVECDDNMRTTGKSIVGNEITITK